MRKTLELNLKPIALIVCCSALGALFDAPLKGLYAGVALVAFATTVTKP